MRTMGDLTFLKWRPGSCKLKALVAEGHWRGRYLNFLAQTSSKQGAFTASTKSGTDLQIHDQFATLNMRTRSTDGQDSEEEDDDFTARSRFESEQSSQGPYEGVIWVLVHSIVGVVDVSGFMDKTDPYVELKLGDVCRRTSTINDAGGNATFCQKFKFWKDKHDPLLRVRVFDKDLMSTDDFLGECSVDIDHQELEPHDPGVNEMDTFKFELFSKKGGTGKNAGYVLLGMAMGEYHELDSEEDNSESSLIS